MKVNQVVYVVMDKNDENLIGAYNEYEDALKALEDYNAPTVSITPVLVDAAPDYGRRLIYDGELMDAYTKSEMLLAETSEEEEEEEEEEDEEEEEEDEEDVMDTIRDFARYLESLL